MIFGVLFEGDVGEESSCIERCTYTAHSYHGNVNRMKAQHANGGSKTESLNVRTTISGWRCD